MPRVGDAGLASEQAQVISSSAESCSGNEFKEQERAKWLKYVVAEGKGDKQRRRQDLGQVGRGLHTLGNLWRVPIKVVDELTFKETMALGQAVRAELERSV